MVSREENKIQNISENESDSSDDKVNNDKTNIEEPKTWKDLVSIFRDTWFLFPLFIGDIFIICNDQGLVDALCKACEQLKWKEPSKIQKEAIPVALQGKDVIGLAETGSGKTAAFALPILQALLENPQRHFALVLTPTRELAFQISEQFEALGK